MLASSRMFSIFRAFTLTQTRSSHQCLLRSLQSRQQPITHMRRYNPFLVCNSKHFSVTPTDPFLNRLSWFAQLNKEPIEDYDLLKKKEKELTKALKNKYELELETLEKIQTHHFKMLEDLCLDSPENKVQSPRFNEIKTMTFQIHQEQIIRLQEAMDVKKVLIIQHDKSVFSKIAKLNDIMSLETKYHAEQITSIKKFLSDLKTKLEGIEKGYGQDPNDKTLELIRGFVRKHEHQLIEQIQRHEELMQRYQRYIQVNVE